MFPRPCLLMLLVAVLIATHVTVVSSQPLIKEKPLNMTVFYDTSKSVNFTCVTATSLTTTLRTQTSNGSVLVATDPGDITYYTETKADENGQLVTIYGVTIVVKLVYNASVVHCQTGREDEILEEADAIFLMQGPPDAVSDLRVESRGYHLMVTWQAPFSLDVTGVEYDITYSLLISNVTNETRPTAVSCAVCRNLTHPNFTFSPPHPLPGHTFTFTVTPQNGAGGGPQSHPVTATLTDVTYSTLATLMSDFLTITSILLTSSTSVPSPPDTGPGQVTGIVLGVLSLAVVLMITLSVLVVLLCVRFKWHTKFSLKPRERHTRTYHELSRSTSHSEDVVELQSLESPDVGFSTSPSTTENVTTEPPSKEDSPSEVRQRHKRSSHSPEESAEK